MNEKMLLTQCVNAVSSLRTHDGRATLNGLQMPRSSDLKVSDVLDIREDRKCDGVGAPWVRGVEGCVHG